MGMIRVVIWKQLFFSSSTPAKMPQLSTPRLVFDIAYLHTSKTQTKFQQIVITHFLWCFTNALFLKASLLPTGISQQQR